MRQLYARVKTESACDEGRVGNNGAHASTVGNAFSEFVKDSNGVLEAGVVMRYEIVVSA